MTGPVTLSSSIKRVEKKTLLLWPDFFLTSSLPIEQDCSRLRFHRLGTLFSKLSIELAAATMNFGGLEQVSQLYKETCARHGRTCGRPADVQVAFERFVRNPR